jgi:hypothetical protein
MIQLANDCVESLIGVKDYPAFLEMSLMSH